MEKNVCRNATACASTGRLGGGKHKSDFDWRNYHITYKSDAGLGIGLEILD